MKLTILPTTNLHPEYLSKYKPPIILYGPETLLQMFSKYPTADAYIIELGARIYVRKDSIVTLPHLVTRKDFQTAHAKTLKKTAFNLRKHPGTNILRMNAAEVSKALGIPFIEAVKMKYREYSTIILGRPPKEYNNLIYWKLDDKTTFVSHPFYPCEFIEELEKYYDVETESPSGNNTPCYL